MHPRTTENAEVDCIRPAGRPLLALSNYAYSGFFDTV